MFQQRKTFFQQTSQTIHTPERLTYHLSPKKEQFQKERIVFQAYFFQYGLFLGETPWKNTAFRDPPTVAAKKPLPRFVDVFFCRLKVG